MPASQPAVRIRAYNVRFGDCVLISFDAGVGEKHILFDFGNAPSGVQNEGGKNDVFAPIAADITARTKGVLDLLVMSHEHLDHMEGFYSEKTVFDRMTVREVWMSIMSAPDYYDRFPNCKPEKSARLALLETARRWDSRGLWDRLPEPMRALIANNVLAVANRNRIDYLRGLPPKKNVKYLHRGARVPATPSLGPGVRIEILAPEKDASTYYPDKNGRMWLQAAGRMTGGVPPSRPRTPKAPAQISLDEFMELREAIAELDLADLLMIDKAANNTSLVVRVTVNGKILLFPGDAEQESWAQMRDRRLLAPVDFLKIAHHGSINGMPFEGPTAVLSRLVKPRRQTIALVSTCRNVYGKSEETMIPHGRLMQALKDSCSKVYVTQDAADFGEGVDILLT